jgi:hypothetical protein
VEPVHAVRRRPGLVAVPVQAVDGNDAGKFSASSCAATGGSLYHRLLSLCHDLETLGRRLKRLIRLRTVTSGWNQSAPSGRRHGTRAEFDDASRAEGS